VVPIVLAITARRNCTRCSSSESGLVAVPATVIEAPPPMLPGPAFIGAPWQSILSFYYRDNAGAIRPQLVGDQQFRRDPLLFEQQSPSGR
jgi:hypothetical protein